MNLDRFSSYPHQYGFFDLFTIFAAEHDFDTSTFADVKPPYRCTTAGLWLSKFFCNFKNNRHIRSSVCFIEFMSDYFSFNDG
jgi:hypothetical protein